jgi:fimbrial chaperone protein
MQKRGWFFLALGAVLVHGALSGADIARPDGVQVTPVIVEIPLERGMSSVRIHNWRDQAVSFDSEILNWSQKDGEDRLTPSKEVLVAPSVFSIPAGGEQIVRLALKAYVRGGKKERAYRLVFRELPSDSPAIGGLRI